MLKLNVLLLTSELINIPHCYIYLYMKFLITESQFDNIVFKYLDNQDFVQVVRGGNIYFVNSDSDKYSQIKYNEDIPWVGMTDDLCGEIAGFFSIPKEESKKIIGLWVKHKFKVRDVLVVQSYLKNQVPILMVPY